ncbi:hypothetical protein HDU85_004248 [Gaertneriomyces sp. JEL0708]|nr:hypothetical protein HDU85_004248 [Gaertneriomyces sp. JEL0708]
MPCANGLHSGVTCLSEEARITPLHRYVEGVIAGHSKVDGRILEDLWREELHTLETGGCLEGTLDVIEMSVDVTRSCASAELFRQGAHGLAALVSFLGPMMSYAVTRNIFSNLVSLLSDGSLTSSYQSVVLRTLCVCVSEPVIADYMLSSPSSAKPATLYQQHILPLLLTRGNRSRIGKIDPLVNLVEILSLADACLRIKELANTLSVNHNMDQLNIAQSGMPGPYTPNASSLEQRNNTVALELNRQLTVLMTILESQERSGHLLGYLRYYDVLPACSTLLIHTLSIRSDAGQFTQAVSALFWFLMRDVTNFNILFENNDVAPDWLLALGSACGINTWSASNLPREITKDVPGYYDIVLVNRVTEMRTMVEGSKDGYGIRPRIDNTTQLAVVLIAHFDAKRRVQRFIKSPTTELLFMCAELLSSAVTAHAIVHSLVTEAALQPLLTWHTCQDLDSAKMDVTAVTSALLSTILSTATVQLSTASLQCISEQALTDPPTVAAGASTLAVYFRKGIGGILNLLANKRLADGLGARDHFDEGVMRLTMALSLVVRATSTQTGLEELIHWNGDIAGGLLNEACIMPLMTSLLEIFVDELAKSSATGPFELPLDRSKRQSSIARLIHLTLAALRGFIEIYSVRKINTAKLPIAISIQIPDDSGAPNICKPEEPRTALALLPSSVLGAYDCWGRRRWDSQVEDILEALCAIAIADTGTAGEVGAMESVDVFPAYSVPLRVVLDGLFSAAIRKPELIPSAVALLQRLLPSMDWQPSNKAHALRRHWANALRGNRSQLAEFIKCASLGGRQVWPGMVQLVQKLMGLDRGTSRARTRQLGEDSRAATAELKENLEFSYMITSMLLEEIRQMIRVLKAMIASNLQPTSTGSPVDDIQYCVSTVMQHMSRLHACVQHANGLAAVRLLNSQKFRVGTLMAEALVIIANCFAVFDVLEEGDAEKLEPGARLLEILVSEGHAEGYNLRNVLFTLISLVGNRIASISDEALNLLDQLLETQVESVVFGADVIHALVTQLSSHLASYPTRFPRTLQNIISLLLRAHGSHSRAILPDDFFTAEINAALECLKVLQGRLDSADDSDSEESVRLLEFVVEGIAVLRSCTFPKEDALVVAPRESKGVKRKRQCEIKSAVVKKGRHEPAKVAPSPCGRLAQTYGYGVILESTRTLLTRILPAFSFGNTIQVGQDTPLSTVIPVIKSEDLGDAEGTTRDGHDHQPAFLAAYRQYSQNEFRASHGNKKMNISRPPSVHVDNFEGGHRRISANLTESQVAFGNAAAGVPSGGIANRIDSTSYALPSGHSVMPVWEQGVWQQSGPISDMTGLGGMGGPSGIYGASPVAESYWYRREFEKASRSGDRPSMTVNADAAVGRDTGLDVLHPMTYFRTYPLGWYSSGHVTDCGTGKIRAFNRAAELLTGYHAIEVIGIMSAVDFLDPIDGESFCNLASKAKIEGVAQEHFTTFVRKDGSRVPVKHSVSCIRASHDTNTVLGVVGMAVDITEQKRLEKQMRELSTAMENAVEGISRLDINGRYIFANKAYAAPLLYEPDDLIGNGWEKTVHPDSMQEIREAFDTMLREGKGMAEVRSVRRDGQIFYKEVTMVPCYDDELGERTGHFCFMREISDRKMQEENLRISQLRLQEAQAIAHLGSWEYDIPTGQIAWSDELYRIFGVDATPENRKKFGMEQYIQLLKEEDRPLILACIDQCTQRGTPYEVDHRIRRVSDGSIRVLCGRGRGIVDADGCVLKIIGTAQDVTEQKQVERELIAAKEEALEASRHKSAFLRNMSHEVRTPINGITGMTSLLLQTPLTPEQAEYANGIRTSASVLLTVVNDILDFSKVEAGKIELEKIPFKISDVVTDVVRMTGCLAEPKGLSLAVDVGDSAGDSEVIGDPNRLSQILINLTSNAIKFTERGQVTIRVRRISSMRRSATLHGDLSRSASPPPVATNARVASAAPEPDSLPELPSTTNEMPPNGKGSKPSMTFLFEVIDTGIGISSDAQKKLFLPFSQADSSTTRKFGGTGLGLSICKSLVTLMDGTIEVTSEEHKGSRFYFILEFPVLRRRKLFGGPRSITSPPMSQASGSASDDPAGLIGPTASPPYSPVNGRPGSMRSSRTSTSSQLSVGGAPPLTDAEKTQLRVLVVEDNDTNRLICKKMLQKSGYERIVLVRNGKECVELVESKREERAAAKVHDDDRMGTDVSDGVFDVVLMDCQMPFMDGYEATRHIRSRSLLPTYTPIIALTANALEGDREKCLESGMDWFLTKPIVMEELDQMVTDGEEPFEGKTSTDEPLSDHSPRIPPNGDLYSKSTTQSI